MGLGSPEVPLEEEEAEEEDELEGDDAEYLPPRLSRALPSLSARHDGRPFTEEPARPDTRRNTAREGPAHAHYAQIHRWERTPLEHKAAFPPPLINRAQAASLRETHNISVSRLFIY